MCIRSVEIPFKVACESVEILFKCFQNFTRSPSCIWRKVDWITIRRGATRCNTAQDVTRVGSWWKHSCSVITSSAFQNGKLWHLHGNMARNRYACQVINKHSKFRHRDPTNSFFFFFFFFVVLFKVHDMLETLVFVTETAFWCSFLSTNKVFLCESIESR